MNGGNSYWWKDKKNPHLGITDVLNRLDGDISDRNETWRRFLSLYLNKTVEGFAPTDKAADIKVRDVLQGGGRLVMNPIENCIETLSSRIASQRPVASFLVQTDTSDGYKMKERALGLQKFVSGEWYRTKAYRKAIRCFKHGGVIGFGILKAVVDGKGRFGCEAVPPWELVVDDQAAYVTDPRQLYQICYVPAEVLAARYPNKRKEIYDSVTQERVSDNAASITVTDLVRVTEAWHLPSIEGGDDGRHVVCIDNDTLTPPGERDWKHDRFPFAIFRWSEPVIGWYPQGLVETQEPTQKEFNKLLGRIQQIMHLYATANTYFEEGSINKKHVKNTSGNMIPYKKGSPKPSTEMPTSISSEVFSWLWQIEQHVYQEKGISQLSAQSMKPAGIESGRALRVLQDNESGRHALLNQAWDDFWCDFAELTVMTLKDIAASNGGYATNYRHKGRIERIDWKKVDLERDAFELQIFPSSMLPNTPAGRMAAVEEMMAAQFITRDQAISLLQMPDLEQFTSLEIAARDEMDWIISELLRGKWYAPEEHQNLEYGIPLAMANLSRSKREGVPDENRQLLMDWIAQAEEMAAPPMPPMGAPMPPMGGGEPPPVPPMAPPINQPPM